MCGISGGLGLPVFDEARALYLQRRRGPDGSGIWRDDEKRISLAHAILHPRRVRRLVLMGSVGVPFAITPGGRFPCGVARSPEQVTSRAAPARVCR